MDHASVYLCEDAVLVTNPTESQLVQFWESRLSIPEEISYSFADASPTFGEFICGIKTGTIICAMAATDAGELIAAGWLHDLAHDYADRSRVGWMGGYIFPGYRGAQAVHASHLILDYFEEIGIHHIHTAIHVDNRKSIMFTRGKSMLSFTFVCRFPNWTTFGGHMADAMIFTKHPRDKMLAWLCARQLAHQRTSAQPVSV